MNFLEAEDNGFIPIYTRTDLTDDLHDIFGFRTDYEIITTRMIKKNLQGYKKNKYITQFLKKIKRLIIPWPSRNNEPFSF